MGIKCLTDYGQEKLIINIDTNIENGNYFKKESWIEEFFEDEEFYFESNLDVELPELMEISEDETSTKYDFENSKKLFLAFKDLDFEQATNPKLWNYLVHTKYWSYMSKRWPIKEEIEVAKRTLKERYFSKVGAGKVLLRNGLSGLWWLSYTTYDEREEDKFIYTKRLLDTADFHVQLMERSFSRNKEFVLNFMKALTRYEKNIRDGKIISKDEHRELFKEINLIGGIKILDILNDDDIYTIIYNFFEEVE